ncbi:MAG: FAD-dependent oxidoreductase [Clostridia bacterium]|nr:FAD-dependent oxidoreductase [Clostridia bacterium]
MYDIAIVGSGPAGLCAAIYARRADKAVLVIEKETFGGEITHSPKVENYPGYPVLSGNDLAEKFVSQTMDLGADFEMDEISGIRREDVFVLSGEYGEYRAKSVILATGSKHRKLGLPKEDELTGHGISYCAVCDGPFYKGKNVAMIGGGNSALQEAIMLSDYCESVTVIQNLDFLTGEPKLQEILKNKPNVTIRYGEVVASLLGEKELSAIETEKVSDHTKTVMAFDGVFVAIGQVPDNRPFENLVELNPQGYIVCDESCRTRTPGIFAAGDCRVKAIRQIVTAQSDGAVAALGAIRFSEEGN